MRPTTDVSRGGRVVIYAQIALTNPQTSIKEVSAAMYAPSAPMATSAPKAPRRTAHRNGEAGYYFYAPPRAKSKQLRGPYATKNEARNSRSSVDVSSEQVARGSCGTQDGVEPICVERSSPVEKQEKE